MSGGAAKAIGALGVLGIAGYGARGAHARLRLEALLPEGRRVLTERDLRPGDGWQTVTGELPEGVDREFTLQLVVIQPGDGTIMLWSEVYASYLAVWHGIIAQRFYPKLGWHLQPYCPNTKNERSDASYCVRFRPAKLVAAVSVCV